MKYLTYSVIKFFLNLIPIGLIVTDFFIFRFFFFSPSLLTLIILIATVYLLPVILYRFLSLALPIKKGFSSVGKTHPPNGWLLSLRCQLPFSIFPFLEKLLIVFPNLYSLWLRLWGSKIGKNVYWTMDTQIIDRTHLNIGNNVFIGNKSYLSPHLGTKKNHEYSIFVQTISIEDNAFIGTHSILGPGTKIKAGEIIKPMSNIIFNKKRNAFFGNSSE